MNNLKVYCGPMIVIDAPQDEVRPHISDEMSDRLCLITVEENPDKVCYLIPNIQGPREFGWSKYSISTYTAIDPVKEMNWFQQEFVKELEYFSANFGIVSLDFAILTYYD